MMMIGLAVVVASSSLYGFGGKDHRGNMGGQHRFDAKDHRGDKKMKKRPPREIYMFMSAVSDQDLTKAQKTDMRKIMEEFKSSKKANRVEKRKSLIKIDDNKKFDKEYFINTSNERAKDRATEQANMIEKVFAILDDKQKQLVIQETAEKQNMKYSGKRDKRKNKGKNKQDKGK